MDTTMMDWVLYDVEKHIIIDEVIATREEIQRRNREIDDPNKRWINIRALLQYCTLHGWI